jgi:putative restriction endonuclease
LLALDKKTNTILLQFLLDNYFPATKDNFNNSTDYQQKLFDDIERKILNEKPSEYKKEIKNLLLDNNEEEVYLRGSLFKREIPKIYNNTCCISGMKINATINVSMIDACHIIPFSESYDDTITNGIALCPNLHRAFDRGLIAIDDNYKVLINHNFVEAKNTVYTIQEFERKQIFLPNTQRYFPSLENIKKHRERFNF